MELPHIVSAKDFTRAQLDALFERAGTVKKQLSNKGRWAEERYVVEQTFYGLLTRQTMALLFDQPSLRTSSSFETAMYALGGNCVTYRNASRESSIAKDESLEDTIEMLSGNPTVSVIVLRHPEVGAAERAASVSSVPVINAGDGLEHPTQALVDLFTIQEALGSVEGKYITLVGDMHARTARSLLYALTLYPNVRVYLFCPRGLWLEENARQYLLDNNLIPTESEHGLLEDKAPSSDLLYVLRPQKENWHKDIKNQELRRRNIEKSVEHYYRFFTVDNRILAHMPKNSIVLHPRPRGPELPTEVDSDPRVLHKVQGRNGGPVRIALLEMMHSGEWKKLANK